MACPLKNFGFYDLAAMAEEVPPNNKDKPPFDLRAGQYELRHIFQTIVNCAEENNKRSGETHKFEPYWSFLDVQHGLKKKILHQGILHVNPNQKENSYVTPPCCILGKDDIHIIGYKNRNRAFEGDRVVVKVLNQKHWVKDNTKKYENKKPTGRVIYILEVNHSRTSLGFIEKLDVNTPNAVLGFQSLDPCVPPMAIIQEFLDWQRKQETSSPFTSMFYTQAQFLQNLLYCAKISSWPVCNVARGVLLDVMGPGHTVPADKLVPLLQQELNSLIDRYNFRFEDWETKKLRFVQKYFNKLYENNTYITPGDLLHRTDLTKQLVFTISPHSRSPDDISVGYSARTLESGSTEIQVHISDVATYFCSEGGGKAPYSKKKQPQSKEAEKVAREKAAVMNVLYIMNKTVEVNCMSIATINRRISSLIPSALKKICSFYPANKKKLAITFEFNVDANGEIDSQRVFASCILSRCHLTYTQVKKVVDNPDDISWLPPEFKHGFQTPLSSSELGELRTSVLQFVKTSRAVLTAAPPRLSLPKPDVKFTIVDDVPKRVHVTYGLSELDDIISHWQYLVDSEAGSQLVAKFPQSALLVRQPCPDERLVQILRVFLASQDIKIDEKNLPAFWQDMRSRDSQAVNLVPVMLVFLNKILQEPEFYTPYRESNTHHFSYNQSCVTQLTSPLNNLTHILAQKQLLMGLSISPAHQDRTLNNSVYMQSIADKHNSLVLKSNLLNKRVTEMYLAMQLGVQDNALNCRAIIVAVYENSVDILVPSLYFTSTLYLDNYKVSTEMECGLWVHEITWASPKHKQTLTHLSIVNVRFSKAEYSFSLLPELRHPLRLEEKDGLSPKVLMVDPRGAMDESGTQKGDFLSRHRIPVQDLAALCDKPVMFDPKTNIVSSVPAKASNPAPVSNNKINIPDPAPIDPDNDSSANNAKQKRRERRNKKKSAADASESALESGSAKSWFDLKAKGSQDTSSTPNRIAELLANEIENLVISSDESGSESEANDEQRGASNGRTNTQSSTRQTSVTSTDSNVQENCPNTKTLPKTTDVTAKEIPAASSHSPQSSNSTVNELKSSDSTNAARSQSVPDQTGANNSAPKSSSAEASSPLPLSGANSIHPFQQKDSTVSPKSPAQDKYATDGARKSPTRPNDTPTPRPLLNQGSDIGSVTSPKATQCLTTASSARVPSTTDPSARVPSTTESSTVRTEGNEQDCYWELPPRLRQHLEEQQQQRSNEQTPSHPLTTPPPPERVTSIPSKVGNSASSFTPNTSSSIPNATSSISNATSSTPNVSSFTSNVGDFTRATSSGPSGGPSIGPPPSTRSKKSEKKDDCVIS